MIVNQQKRGTSLFFLNDFNGPVVIAVVAVLVVQASIDNIIYVVAMRDSFMTTAFAMCVFATIKSVVADIGVLVIDLKTVFVIMPVVWVVQMPVMQVVYVVAMAYGGMTAVFAVRVFVVWVGIAAHDCSLFGLVYCRAKKYACKEYFKKNQ